MTAPAYDKDLVDITTADGSTGFAEATATGWTNGGAQVQDADYPYIQGSATYNSVLQAMTKSGIAALLYNNGSGITIPTDGAFLVWHLCYTTTLLDTYENGGIRVMVGSGLGDFDSWDVGGSNAGRMPFGGFQNFAVNPTVSYDDRLGTGLGNAQYVGAAINLTAGVSKGYPNIIDAIRYGRCEARFNYGEVGDPATLAGFAALNDAQNARWGLIGAAPGGYTWKGLMTIGYSVACRFEASNTMIFVEDQRKVTANFNKIEVKNSSVFILTNVTIQALGTASKGRYETVSGTATLTGCAFVDMDTFVFGSSDSITDTIFRRCGQVTQGSSTIEGCLFTRSTAAKALLVNDITKVTNCEFVSTGTGHAIEGFSASGSYDISSLSFTDYASSDGSTGNEAIHVTATAGTVTLNYSGSAPSVKSDGATIVKQTSQITLTISPIITGSDIVIYEAGTTTVIESSQNIAGTSYQYIYGGDSVSDYIDIGIFMAGYTPFYIRNYQLGSSSTTVPATQQVDRFYLT